MFISSGVWTNSLSLPYPPLKSPFFPSHCACMYDSVGGTQGMCMLDKGSVIELLPHYGAWMLLLMVTVYTPSQICSSVNLVKGRGFKTRPSSKPRERYTVELLNQY